MFVRTLTGIVAGKGTEDISNLAGNIAGKHSMFQQVSAMQRDAMPWAIQVNVLSATLVVPSGLKSVIVKPCPTFF